VKHLETNRFDLAIILDADPNPGALAMLEAFGKIDPDLKAIVSKDYAAIEDLAEAADRNIYAYIPISPHSNGIRSVVARALAADKVSVETFNADIKMYGTFVAIIGDRDETLEAWLRKRSDRYKDKEVKLVLITGPQN
jgi:DNA-binding NtrC family response regulator